MMNPTALAAGAGRLMDASEATVTTLARLAWLTDLALRYADEPEVTAEDLC
jgi:hypothetical protein